MSYHYRKAIDIFSSTYKDCSTEKALSCVWGGRECQWGSALLPANQASLLLLWQQNTW